MDAPIVQLALKVAAYMFLGWIGLFGLMIIGGLISTMLEGIT